MYECSVLADCADCQSSGSLGDLEAAKKPIHSVHAIVEEDLHHLLDILVKHWLPHACKPLPL